MTEQQYMNQLSNLSKKIQRGGAREALRLLNELFEWKPVRLRWYIVKAEALAALGRWDEIPVMLRGRYDFSYKEPDAVSYVELYKKYLQQLGDGSGTEMCSYLQEVLSITTFDPSSKITSMETMIAEKEMEYLEAIGDKSRMEELLHLYYVSGHFVEYSILDHLYNQLFPDSRKDAPTFFFDYFLQNIWYLLEKLNDGKPHVFTIVIDEEYHVSTAYVLASVIKKLGHKVYLIAQPVIHRMNAGVNIGDTVDISMDNIEDMDGIAVIHPIRCVKDGNKEDNLPYILHFIERQIADDIMMLIAPSYQVDDLISHPKLRRCSERLGSLISYVHEDYYTFGYIGKYMTHLKDLFHMDAEYEMTKKAACRFSIILPVRNSVETFQYTLKTCLNQRYKDFEIVVSDNSDEGYQEICHLIKEINSPKIQYYKAPRRLSLSKSFEFAFLKARGEFLLSLGADDGLLPWGLEILDQTLSKYPQENIFCWDRGFYIWPNFINKNQNGQFMIPRAYQKNKVNLEKWGSEDCLNRLAEAPATIYAEPLFYINSGFRRNYMQTLLEKTGGLWAGHSQDIYTGMANLCINNYILHMNYPVSIAGMSSSSCGASDKVLNHKNVGLVARDSNICIEYPDNHIERSINIIGTDGAYIFNEALRLIRLGLLPEKFKNGLSLKTMLEKSLNTDFKRHAFCDRNVSAARTAAESLCEKERLEIEQICNQLDTPEKQGEIPDHILVYQPGFTDNGGLILDARKFDVKNIEEAVMLFENITNL